MCYKVILHPFTLAMSKTRNQDPETGPQKTEPEKSGP